jgi:choriolysin H
LIFTFAANSNKKVVLEGLREIENHTCIRFVRRTYQSDYVQIINDDGCYSPLGRTGGKQQLSLSRGGCVYKGTVMHEFIHALGYHHMHNHIDRDKYVTVYIENVDPDMAFNFDKVDPAVFGNFNTTYDYLSVMHYPKWAFSNNGKDTMVPTDISYLDKIGASELTDGDIARINNMYECKV